MLPRLKFHRGERVIIPVRVSFGYVQCICNPLRVLEFGLSCFKWKVEWPLEEIKSPASYQPVLRWCPAKRTVSTLSSTLKYLSHKMIFNFYITFRLINSLSSRPEWGDLISSRSPFLRRGVQLHTRSVLKFFCLAGAPFYFRISVLSPKSVSP